jgi:NADH-quinone oxidoreductase subunit M
MAILVPLAVVTLWMGVHPSTFTRLFDPVVMQAVHGHVATGLSAGATHVGTAQDIVNVASR